MSIRKLMSSINDLEDIYNNIVSISIEEGKIREQIRLLKIVGNLHRQGRISDDVMQVLFMELALDIA
jgi:hypothetical protein